MRLVVDSIEVERNEHSTYWILHELEVFEEGDPEKIWGTTDESGVTQLYPVRPGQAIPHVARYPANQVLHRAAEYGIDPDDIDTLLDVLVCERFITREWWASDDHLFAAGSIDEARRLYLAEIARIKLKHRISTRRRGTSSEHPLNELREIYKWHPADLALKTMGVLLYRHRVGVQELEPTVAKALTYMESALSIHPDTDNSVSSKGYSNA